MLLLYSLVILDYVEDVPNYTQNNSADFSECFAVVPGRMWRVNEKSTGGKTQISVRKQLPSTLWYLDGLDLIMKMTDRFGVSESSNYYLPKVFCWSRGEQIDITVGKFSERNNFPNIASAIDDTHITIRAPNDDMVLPYCHVGFPGSCQDTRILRQSYFFGMSYIY